MHAAVYMVYSVVKNKPYFYSFKVCELGLEWLFANGDTDSRKVDLDQIEGEGKLVSLRGGEGAQFSVQLSSGLVLTGRLPPIYPHTLVG